MPGSPSANLICAISCPPGSVCPTQIFDWIEDYTVIPRLVYGKVSEQLRPRPWAHSGFLDSAATGSPGQGNVQAQLFADGGGSESTASTRYVSYPGWIE